MALRAAAWIPRRSLSRMELRHLRYFVAIAGHEHIGRAARVLHVSSSPLSRQIHQLEEDIGVQLLARVGRRVQLTEAGKVFQREARETLAGIDRAIATAQAASRGEVGRLRVAFVEVRRIAESIPPAVRQFRARHPRVTVELVPMRMREQLEAFDAGRIDALEIDALLTFRVGREPVVGQNSVATLDSGRQGSEAGRQMPLVLALLGALRAALGARSDLVLENLALRQQLALLRRRAKRPRVGQLDRLFWMWLSHRSVRWREALHVVQPQTVIRWHRQGFRAFWNWKSRRGRTGRPPVDSELAKLVRTMALANPLWGAPRIHGELLKLGLDVSQRTVGRLMPRRAKPPSQTWRTFLENHVADLVSVDFFVVPTATFRVLYVFVVLLHHRRRVVHFNVTDSPTAAWTAQQVVEAFPHDSAPGFSSAIATASSADSFDNG